MKERGARFHRKYWHSIDVRKSQTTGVTKAHSFLLQFPPQKAQVAFKEERSHTQSLNQNT